MERYLQNQEKPNAKTRDVQAPYLSPGFSDFGGVGRVSVGGSRSELIGFRSTDVVINYK